MTFDFRSREHAVMWGNALSFGFEQGDPRWGGDAKFEYWKARASYEHSFRLWRRHNFVLRTGAFAGENLPFWSENSAGGANLRGYLYHQFAGDTHLRGQAEYHFPLFSIKQLDVRGVFFADSAALWYRTLPARNGDTYVDRADGRRFLPPRYLEARLRS